MAENLVEFTIPSIHRPTQIACRVSFRRARTRVASQKLGAIIAHPWASLGGSYDDPAVLAAADALCEQGFVVGTFNFRGARPSTGSASWSGKGEMEDYMSFIGFFVHYLRQMLLGDKNAPITLVLGGYSYGSVILSNLPPLETILKRFDMAAKPSTESDIIEVASTLSAQGNAEAQPSDTNALASDISIVPAYLLISPVLGYLKRFLYWGKPAEPLFWGHRVLVIHGTEDGFTSVETVKDWIPKDSSAVLKAVDNGHIWVDTFARKQLREYLEAWAAKLA